MSERLTHLLSRWFSSGREQEGRQEGRQEVTEPTRTLGDVGLAWRPDSSL